MDKNEFPTLGPDERDRGVAILKSVAGFAPGVGSALAEIINRFIPNQRIDRIEQYIQRLHEALRDMPEALIRERIHSPESVDLFEEGGFQSARAISEERREQIANVVAYGLSGEDKERIEAKRVLKLLRELDDDQIIILTAHLSKNMFDDDFQERNQHILYGPAVHMQSSREEMDQATMIELAKAQLISLGLLRPRFKNIKKGEIPEFDSKTGTIKRQSLDISPLGRLVLRRIGIAGDDDV